MIACSSLLLAGALAFNAPAPAPSEAPGGYWTLGEQQDRRREPKDGEDELTVGSVLLSLGMLRAGAGLVSVWMADQSRFCPGDDPAVDCGPLRTYGWVGLGEAGLMVGTGIVYLAMGAHHRRRHAAWRRGEPLSLRVGRGGQWLSLRPWVHMTPSVQSVEGVVIPRFAGEPRFTLTGGGLRVHVRF